MNGALVEVFGGQPLELAVRTDLFVEHDLFPKTGIHP
jgi:hypothetical protein